MEIKQYQAAMEAVLFSAGEPVPLSRLAEALELDEESAGKLAEDLLPGNQYENRRYPHGEDGGPVSAVYQNRICLLCPSGAGHSPEYASLQAAMEVLAIIAYNQPVTKAFVEQVRGVDCGAVLQGLVSKSLVEEKGRLELPGRPLLYGTTPDFLRCFGITGLQELPPLPQQEENGMEETTLDDVIEENESRSGE